MPVQEAIEPKRWRHTQYASYLGYITQAIVNNLSPLLFLIFQDVFQIPLEKITLLVTVNFCVQLSVDLIAARFVDKIGYRPCVVAAHLFAAAGLIGLGVFPWLFPDPFLGLLLAVLLYAVGGGLIEVLISPIVEACPTENKASVMSLLHSFYCWGTVGVILLSTLFFQVFGKAGWPVLTVLWALLPLCNAFFFTKVPIAHLTEDGEGLPIRKLFSMKLFWVFAALMVAAGACEFDTYSYVRTDFQFFRYGSHSPQLVQFFDDDEYVTSHFLRQQGKLDIAFVLVPVADNHGIIVDIYRQDGVQFRLGTGFEPYIVFGPVPDYFLDYGTHLVYFDRIYYEVLRGIAVLVGSSPETVGNLFYPVVEYVRETEQHRGRDIPHLEFLHQLLQIDGRPVFLGSHGHVTFLINRKIIQAPAFNVVKFRRIFNSPFSHLKTECYFNKNS